MKRQPTDLSLHRLARRALSGLPALLLAASAAFAASAAPAEPGVPSTERPAHGLIVRMSAGASPADWQRVARAAGLEGAPVRASGARARLLGADRVLAAAPARELAQRLRMLPGVAWVEPNARERRLQAVVPNDPDFGAGLQWWLRPALGSNSNVLADRLRGVPGFQTAWIQSRGAADSVVAVLDTGYTEHPELAGRVINGYDFVSELDYANDGDGRDADAHDPGDWVSPEDRTAKPAIFGDCAVENSNWHGTVIAGQLVALTDNGVGGAAMQWQGKVLAVRVAGKCGATVADIVDGMRWAAGLPVAGAPPNPHPARVIVVSFGGSAACGSAYQEAIDDLRTVGAVVVAAAGNEHGAVLRPASCRGAIGVGAVNRDGFKTSYSNFGAELSLSTVGGDPAGEGRWGPWLGDPGLYTVTNAGTRGPGDPGHGPVFGTSFSAPLVAGAASLMLAVRPTLTAEQLVAGLQASARPHVTSPVIGRCSAANPGRCLCTTATCGAGLLDVPEALRYAADPAGYTALARTGAVIDNAEIRAAVALGADLPGNGGSGDGGGGISGGALGGPLGILWAFALAAAVRLARRAVRPI